MDDELAFPGQEVDDEESHAPDNPATKKKPKSGGFQSMGLSPAVYKSVMRKGYKVAPGRGAPTAARHTRGPCSRFPPPPAAALTLLTA